MPSSLRFLYYLAIIAANFIHFNSAATVLCNHGVTTVPECAHGDTDPRGEPVTMYYICKSGSCQNYGRGRLCGPDPAGPAIDGSIECINILYGTFRSTDENSKPTTGIQCGTRTRKLTFCHVATQFTTCHQCVLSET